MSASLKGRSVLITGAGSGIGLAMAHEFAKWGAKVAMLDTNVQRLEEAERALAIYMVETLTLQADASDPADIAGAIDKTIATFGRIHVLCNNAGITDMQRPLLETKPQDWDRVIAVNLSGPFHFCRLVLPHMIKSGGGAIVNTASVASHVGGRGGLSYTAAKHGLLGITRSIAIAYGDRNIRCNAVSPGSIVTNIADGELGGKRSELAATIRDRGIATRHRRGLPDEISPAAVYLASDEARYVNGHSLVVDGAWSVY
ncbi:MAG: SDR family NAD(P)-dependent oxidoreductase [Betaproteobacteria bacterium]